MVTNRSGKTLEPFIDKGFIMVTDSVKVVAKNSPHNGRNMTVDDAYQRVWVDVFGTE
jgi:hypothetical protein